MIPFPFVPSVVDADLTDLDTTQVQFGSDFDFLPANFPRNPFNIGMKIAHYVDEANSWCENPPHGRPYIMSPYTACMTSFWSVSSFS